LQEIRAAKERKARGNSTFHETARESSDGPGLQSPRPGGGAGGSTQFQSEV
jgi:hypothetical protein